MILSTVKIEDLDRFLKAFSTRGAEKRGQHGCQGSHVFRDPADEHRVWLLFDWDEKGYNGLLSDPEAPPIFQAAGVRSEPELAELVAKLDA